jgi:cytidylate kinase
MIVAIDGPVAAGKGTLARKVAEALAYHYLDTGSLYRAVALKLLRQGKSAEDETAAREAALGLGDVDLDDPALRDEATGRAASVVSAFPSVRAALLEFQRTFARRSPGAVLDGRDVGSVVCPDADVKLYVTADTEVRARRRLQELEARGTETTYETVLRDLEERDRADISRASAPLKRAPDAHLLDTTNLDIEAAFREAMRIIGRFG